MRAGAQKGAGARPDYSMIPRDGKQIKVRDDKENMIAISII